MFKKYENRQNKATLKAKEILGEKKFNELIENGIYFVEQGTSKYYQEETTLSIQKIEQKLDELTGLFQSHLNH